MLASYEADFASNFGRRTRNVIEQHQDELLVNLSEDSTAANRWHTPEGGGMVTAGVGGPLTGKGAHLLLVDDPHKNAEEAYSEAQQQRLWEWWTSTALTRLEPGAAVIVIQTRWHEGDLAGRILKHEGPAWRVLRLPAIADGPDEIGRTEGDALWPARYDVAALHQIRRSVGSRVWEAGYQQAPVAETGTVFQRKWFAARYAWVGEEHVALPDGRRLAWKSLQRFITMDLALSTKSSADYSVIGVFGRTPDDLLLMLDMDRARREGPDHIPALKRLLSRWKVPIAWVEKAGVGLGLIQEARRRGVPVRELEADKDKYSRAILATPRMEGGRFLLPAERDWAEDAVSELLGFPMGRHDDIVDVVAYAARVALTRGWSIMDLGPVRDRDEYDPRTGLGGRAPDARALFGGPSAHGHAQGGLDAGNLFSPGHGGLFGG